MQPLRNGVLERLFVVWSIFYWIPPPPERGDFGAARGKSRFLLQAKPPLSKGGLEGLSI